MTESPKKNWHQGNVKKIGLPVLALAVGAMLAIGLIKTSPKAKRQTPPRQARLVEVHPVKFDNHRTVIHAMGTVLPVREVALRPRVGGLIVSVSENFVPGGRFQEGDVLLQIDPTDFRLAIRQRESDMAQARSELALELGQQAVARREFEMLGETIQDEDLSLVLRQPQLERVRARLQAAEAALEQAKLDWERSTVRAPFNAVVRSREVNVGMQVTTSTTLAMLTGTGAYWIEASVPVDQLKWIKIPHTTEEKGSSVRIFNEAAWGNRVYRDGHVVQLLNDLESEGRMARVLIEVGDPLSLEANNQDRPRMLLDSYVRTEIQGIELDSVAAVDRTIVRNGNTVWVMNEQGNLEIRPIEIVFRGREQLFIRDSLRDDERLVVTDLSAPVEGMPLRTSDGGVHGAQSQ